MGIEALRVLVLEDHEFQRKIAVNLLKQLGVREVLEAADGREALDRVAGATGRIDVVLVDLRMPGMDGVQFMRAIAQDHLATAVVITSSVDPGLVSAAEAMGAEHGVTMLGALSKPLTPHKLRNVLAKFPGERAVPRGATAWRPSAAELTHALDNNELRVFYQPEVEFTTLRVTALEALVRWSHTDRGLLLPETFLDLAEEHGLMRRLTDYVLDRSLADLSRWKSQGMEVAVGLNLAASVLGRPGSADDIQAKVAAYGCTAAEVFVEVTEDSAATDDIVVIENLLRMRLKGFGLALDDYGTGYATMQQLNRLPLSHLKIDSSFVTEAANRPKLRTLLESSITLAHKLGLKAVAEGIETEEAWELLRSLQCDIAQGFLVAHPMPAETVVDWHHNWVHSAS
jgi:EAL domain-containing protein (putative c-di-GMP-specific phosphodiesterase class I)/ActR/RegA family two-component response regulator